MFYKNVGFFLEGVWLWRISGGYSQEMMGLVLGDSHSNVPHEVFLRGKRYLKINLHFSRKIWPTNYGKWCAITTNGSPILIMKKLFQFSLRQIWRQPTSSIWNTFLNLTDTQKRTATCRKNVVSKIGKHLNNFIFFLINNLY